MYSDVGKKIKTLATVCACFGVIISIALGAVLMINEALMGLLLIACGCICAWLGYLTLYAFGEITDCIQDIRNQLCDGEGQRGVVEPAQNSMEGEDRRAVVTSVKDAPPEEVWTCYDCGTKNLRRFQYCSKCKVYRDWSDAQWKK